MKTFKLTAIRCICALLSLVMVVSVAIFLTGCSSLHPYWDARLVQRGYPEITWRSVNIRGLTNAGMQQRILTVPTEINGIENIRLTGRDAFPGGNNISPNLGILEGVIFEDTPWVAAGDDRGGGFFRGSNLRWVELLSAQETAITNGGAEVNSRFPVGTVIIYRGNSSQDFNRSELDNSLVHIFSDDFPSSATPDEIWSAVKNK